MAKNFSFEDDPSMSWVGDSVIPSLCDQCLNRLQNGECDLHSISEIEDVIDTGNCEDFLEKH